MILSECWKRRNDATSLLPQFLHFFEAQRPSARLTRATASSSSATISLFTSLAFFDFVQSTSRFLSLVSRARPRRSKPPCSLLPQLPRLLTRIAHQTVRSRPEYPQCINGENASQSEPSRIEQDASSFHFQLLPFRPRAS